MLLKVQVGVYVREGHRRDGVGKLLLEDAIRRAPELGIKTLTAGAFAHNAPSVGLFERFDSSCGRAFRGWRSSTASSGTWW